MVGGGLRGVYARRAEGEIAMLRGDEVERSLRIEVKMRITRDRKIWSSR